MKAPDKVYFTSTEDGTHYYTEGIPFEREYVEYVRKDTIINKAYEWIENNVLSSNQQDKSRSYFEQFKEYMKGE